MISAMERFSCARSLGTTALSCCCCCPALGFTSFIFTDTGGLNLRPALGSTGMRITTVEISQRLAYVLCLRVQSAVSPSPCAQRCSLMSLGSAAGYTLKQTSIGALRAVVINYVSCIKRRLIHCRKEIL